MIKIIICYTSILKSNIFKLLVEFLQMLQELYDLSPCMIQVVVDLYSLMIFAQFSDLDKLKTIQYLGVYDYIQTLIFHHLLVKSIKHVYLLNLNYNYLYNNMFNLPYDFKTYSCWIPF